MLERAQNVVGGIPDLIMRDGLLFDGKKNALGRDEYLERLAYYDRYGRGPSPRFFAPMPTTPPTHRVLGTRSFQVDGPAINAQGEQVLITYPSGYEVKQPALEPTVAAYPENKDCYTLLWQHDARKPRPLVLCVHGFQMGTPKRAMSLFKVQKLFAMGLDVALFFLPHHWKRAPNPKDVRKQNFINPHDVPLTIEALGQTTHDLRSTTLLLTELGFEKQALIGASLGGYAVSLYSLIDDSPDCIFAVVPAVRFDQTLQPRGWKLGFRVDDEVREKTTRALHVVAPASYTPKMNVDNIGVVFHQGDRLTGATYVQEWVERWGIKNVTSIPGGHWATFDSKARGKAWYGWLERYGFVGPKG